MVKGEETTRGWHTSRGNIILTFSLSRFAHVTCPGTRQVVSRNSDSESRLVLDHNNKQLGCGIHSRARYPGVHMKKVLGKEDKNASRNYCVEVLSPQQILFSRTFVQLFCDVDDRLRERKSITPARDVAECLHQLSLRARCLSQGNNML